MHVVSVQILLTSLVLLHTGVSIIRDITSCHKALALRVSDGIVPAYTFPWLGFAQFQHVTSRHRLTGRSPRVVLVQHQFVLGTALDLIHPTKNYELTTIIFGEYERDEDECQLTAMQLHMGMKCPRAYLEMPIVDVVPHPEHSRFGVINSLALVKLLRPLKSYYSVPICLPTFSDRKRKHKTKIVFLIDYMNGNPVDPTDIRIGKTTLKLLTHRQCREHRLKFKLDKEGVTHLLCTSGCGMRPGAPIVSHTVDGSYELVGISAGGGACTQPSMRHRLNRDPPLYIDVYPYNTWIINVITAHTMPKPYSQNFMLMEGEPSVYIQKRAKNVMEPPSQKEGWSGRTFLVGDSCFTKTLRYNQNFQKITAFFYLERFYVITSSDTKLKVNMQISAGVECTITCVHLIMPNRRSLPKVKGVGLFNLTINFDTEYFPKAFEFVLGIFGKNTTQENFQWFKERDLSFW